MKLRQKLAMVMAAAMIVTAIPVTTMAASTNKFNKTVSIVKDSVLNAATGLALEFTIDKLVDVANDPQANAVNRTFFIKSKDFEFDAYPAYTDGDDFAFTVSEDKKQLKVVIKKAAFTTATTLSVPVLGTVKGEAPTLTVDGYDSVVNSGEYIIGKGEAVTDKALKATAGDKGKISIDGYGELGEILIDEVVAGAAEAQTITIELPRRSEVIFTGEAVTVKGDRGLDGELVNAAGQTVSSVAVTPVLVADKGDRVLEITLPAFSEDATRGAVKLTGIKVEPKDQRKDCKEGEVSVTVKSEKMADTTLKVADILASGISVTTTKDFAIEAGREEKELEITIKENSIDTISAKRDLYVNIEGAKFIEVVEGDDYAVAEIKDGELIIETKDSVNDTTIDEIKVKVKVHATAGTAGDIELSFESKDLEEEVTHTAGKVTAPFTVDAKGMTVKVGQQGQIDKDTEIVITEAEAGKFVEGSKIILDLGTKYNLDIVAADVEVDGDLEVKTKIVDETLEITIKEESLKDEPSVITIKNIEVDVDRTVPQGTFNATLRGNAVCSVIDEREVDEDATVDEDEIIVEHVDGIKLEKFITVGTKNTEDLENITSVVKVTANATAYVKDGVEVAIEDAGLVAVLNADNRMMAPLRLVGDVFGAKYTWAHNEAGAMVVTFFKGDTTVQFVAGQKSMNKNGIVIGMDTAPYINEAGYTMVPVRALADSLGVDVEWAPETNTATFTNK
ncbi:MAG: copper amine oxidase N-terminal domain-containing protein [Cellulosilyticaceae bacterium]